MKPSGPADGRTLLRRVYFDLAGLPPTPDAIEAFATNRSATAFERLVDDLLASPRYGERWARHWIDVTHFAETHGHDQDRIRTNAWPYRDYIIDVFNADKPYARFIEEQLAGDVLFPADPQAVVALGFIAAGPWDESSLRDIREDTVDRQIGRYLDRDDMLTTTMSAFTSTTVHCARCHDHKFDPIPQRDYYSLQAVFAATDRAERLFDPDPVVHQKRQALLRSRTLLEQRDDSLVTSLLAPSRQAEIDVWAAALSHSDARWTPLVPLQAVSEKGATLTGLPDGSVYSGAQRPDRDTYVVIAETGAGRVTGLRIELLTDDRLPHHGPGRQDNGNLHLSEFRVYSAPGRATQDDGQSVTNRVELAAAQADFDQDGWTIRHALDGDIKTAWGIYPQVGIGHAAVFELKCPIESTNGTTFKFVLDQLHGSGHLIGRFRLSITTNAPPFAITPHRIGELLAVAPQERSHEQRFEIASNYLYEKIERDLAKLASVRRIYAGASDFIPDGSHKPARVPRPIHILKRGDINKPGEAAAPGALTCVGWLPSRFALADPQNEGSRRAALARWLTNPENPLTWRSIVNRVWHYHFGRGIVDTPNDFGRMGGLPSHPELLDWLAVGFRDHGGSLKWLHKVIVLSATYQQASDTHDDCAAKDGDNRLLWRMSRDRLDAESIRDAILQISGSLNLKMGGPSFRNFVLSPGVAVTPVVDYSKGAWDEPENNRRSIYRFLFRTVPDPFMDTLDCPDGSQIIAARTASFTSLQAMTLLNDPFVIYQSERFAARLAAAGGDITAQVEWACRLAWGRPPTPDEWSEFRLFVAKHGLANFCRLLLNSNEFLFLN